jgi:hypothetical protein
MLAAASTAGAQTVWAGAAGQFDVQRFPTDVVPNRLDGSAGGWTALAGTRVWRQVGVQGEWAADTITDVQTLTLELGGRSAAIQSTLVHRTRTVSALAAYLHPLGSRVHLAYLGGAAWISISRTFTTDAAGIVLTTPSDTGATNTSTTDDRSVTPAAGVDATVKLWRHLSVFGGVRIHALPLSDDTSGWSVRIIAGGRCVF